MKLQLSKIIIYGKNKQIRQVDFELGKLNILNGDSKTGKSALIEIIDYCWGSKECNIPIGPIRSHSEWYAIWLEGPEGNLFLCRRNPTSSSKSSSEFFIARNIPEVPKFDELQSNANRDGIRNIISSALSVEENSIGTEEGGSSQKFTAGARHAIQFCLQSQSVVASNKVLFNGQSSTWSEEHLRSSIPFFLGAIQSDRVKLTAKLRDLRKRRNALQTKLDEAKAVIAGGLDRARSLVSEGVNIGLIQEEASIETEEEAISILETMTGIDTSLSYVEPDIKNLNELRDIQRSLKLKLSGIRQQIREIRAISESARTFDKEGNEQRARLASINLIKEPIVSHSVAVCPLCDNDVIKDVPTVTEIQKSFHELDTQLSEVTRDTPKLDARLGSLSEEKSEITTRLAKINREIDDIYKSELAITKARDLGVVQAKVQGRVSLYLESRRPINIDAGIPAALKNLDAEIEELTQKLDPDRIKELIDSALRLLSGYMTEYALRFDVEHIDEQSSMRLDITNLTAVIDTIDKVIPFRSIGSADNAVGIHLATHLALHQMFVLRNRPVPSFLIIDQPSQAHYPRDTEVDWSEEQLMDEERLSVLNIFKILNDFVEQLNGACQIIVVDHAEFSNDWFQDAIIARWRKEGEKLIPFSWINSEQ